jgi:hypothetical protein
MAKAPAEFDQTSDLHTVQQATVTWESGITPSYSEAHKNGNMARLNLYGILTVAKGGNSKIATLPDGYVPAHNQRAIFMGKYNNVLQPCIVTIRSDGNITLSTGSQNFPSGDVIAFDTMYFLD